MPRLNAIPINPEAIRSVGERIRTARAMAGLTRPELEKLHGIKSTTIAKWENGLAMPSLKSAHQLVNAIKSHSVFCSVEWFLYGRGQEAYVLDHPTSLDFLHRNTSTFDSSQTELDSDVLLMEEIRNFKRIYSNAVVCLVNDDVMMPQFVMGDYVGGLKLPEKMFETALNKACIVELVDGRKKLRQVVSGSQKGLYNLCGTNNRAQVQPSIIMDVELKSISPIIWHRFMI